jgi:hypothetical protein
MPKNSSKNKINQYENGVNSIFKVQPGEFS